MFFFLKKFKVGSITIQSSKINVIFLRRWANGVGFLHRFFHRMCHNIFQLCCLIAFPNIVKHNLRKQRNFWKRGPNRQPFRFVIFNLPFPLCQVRNCRTKTDAKKTRHTRINNPYTMKMLNPTVTLGSNIIIIW